MQILESAVPAAPGRRQSRPNSLNPADSYGIYLIEGQLAVGVVLFAHLGADALGHLLAADRSTL